MYNKTEKKMLKFHTHLWVDVNLKGYLSSQQRHKLTETNLCKKNKINKINK